MKKTYQHKLALLKLCTKIELTFSDEISFRQKLYTIVRVIKGTLNLQIDETALQLSANQIAFFTPNEYVKILDHSCEVQIIQFNNEFYSICGAELELSPESILFFGSHRIPVLNLCSKEQNEYSNLFDTLLNTLDVNNNLQEEMLSDVLKKYLVQSTHILQEQKILTGSNKSKTVLMRQFVVLLEHNYKKHHKVNEYARLLNKSPKTITNQFKILGLENPSTFIQNRLLVEAKRYLIYTSKSIKEMAFVLGFTDASTFSHFFKGKTLLSPSDYRKKHKSLASRKKDSVTLDG